MTLPVDPPDETRREEARWRIARLRAVLNRTADEEPTSPRPARSRVNFTPADRRTSDNAKRHRDTIRAALNHLTDDIIDDLVRRNQHAAVDAYTTGTSTGSNDVSKPTEATVIRDAGWGEGADTWPTVPDPVQQAINHIFAQLAEAAGVLVHADRQRAYVYAIADRANGRISSLAGDCARCAKPVTGAVGDKLVSGYCSACRKAWERADYPDRHQFEKGYQAAS